MAKRHINYMIIGPPETNRKFKLSKEEYLLERIKGKSREQIAAENNITMNTLVNRILVKWKIRNKQYELAAIEEYRRTNGETENQL